MQNLVSLLDLTGKLKRQDSAMLFKFLNLELQTSWIIVSVLVKSGAEKQGENKGGFFFKVNFGVHTCKNNSK